MPVSALEDVGIRDAALSGPIIDPVTSREVDPEPSLVSGSASRGALTGVLLGATFWLILFLGLIAH